MPPIDLRYTKSQVKRAGKILRRVAESGSADASMPDTGEVAWALDVLDNWRACHTYALTKATMGLRSRVGTAAGMGDVSQRLKRRPTILDKLRREPSMQLTTMHDIAGCRAIVGSVLDVRRVQRRWKGSRVHRTYDYLEKPRASGYRGVHLIVVYDGYMVEVQLRSRIQHEWAYTIETVGSRIGEDLKSGQGPPSVLHFFQLVSEAMAMEEEGLVVPEGLMHEISRARSEARPALRRRGEPS